MFFYLGEKVELVDNKLRASRNRAKLWKYGYNASIDAVIISKDGTLGEIFRVNGLNIGLPEKPKDKEIINSEKQKKNQKWQREEMPQGISEDNQHKHIDYIDREYDRREQGAWVYINGQLVYLSRTYYYFLQWVREGNKYPNFRLIQNELMLYWEACKADERCFGICFVKPRRFGWSALAFTELLEAGTAEENKLLGMMSKKGTDAKKIFNRMVRSFKRLPFFFMPELDGTTTPKTELVFADQSKKRKTGEKVVAGSGLDTSITWHNTEVNAMDGDEIFRSVIDECFAEGTKILMEDMSFKNIEEISVGDYVLVEGGKKVRVAKTMFGQDEMFLVKQPYSKDYVVNSKHRLYLEEKGLGELIITPEEYLSLEDIIKSNVFGVRSEIKGYSLIEMDIEPIGKGNYFGIQLEADNDNDRRLILEDFTISMNCGKFPKDVPFSEYWSIVQTSHTIGSDIVGKCMAGSTVNALKKGGAEFKSVYDDSDPNERQVTGETKSGLYRLFIPSKYCLAGFFDEYGFSVVEDPEKPVVNDLNKTIKIGSVTYLNQKLSALKSKPEKYNERLRQFPDTDRDAFRDESGDCAFNLMNILEQIDHNDNELNDRFDGVDDYYGNDLVERGNLFWKDGIPDTEVIWKPDLENGRWFIKKGCHPPQQYRNLREMKMKNGMLAFAPTGDMLGCFGVDPYNRSKNADGRGSKGSFHLYLKPNTSDLPNDEFIVEYIDRPKTVTQFFEDVLMSCIYWSVPMLGELSNEALFKHFKDRKYRHFCLNNPIKKYHELSPTEKEYGGFSPQGETAVDAQFHAVEEFIESRVGVAKDESNRPLGEMGIMPFTRTLLQIKDVDVETPAGRRKYDAYISASLALLGCQRRIKVKEEVKEEHIEYFIKYDNSGTYSKEIS